MDPDLKHAARTARAVGAFNRARAILACRRADLGRTAAELLKWEAAQLREQRPSIRHPRAG